MFYKIADPLPWYRWWSYDLNGCSVLVLDAKSRNESCMSRRILLLKQWRTSISPTRGPRSVAVVHTGIEIRSIYKILKDFFIKCSCLFLTLWIQMKSIPEN